MAPYAVHTGFANRVAAGQDGSIRERALLVLVRIRLGRGGGTIFDRVS